jgi:predicted transport protein
MTQQDIYFKGIGTYDTTTGKASYNVILPKLNGLAFNFDTNDVHIVIWNDKKCLMIYTQNGKDDDNYGTTPEVVQIEFTVPNVKEFGGGDITIIIKHDDEKPSTAQRSIPTNGGKPGTVGIGVIKP